MAQKVLILGDSGTGKSASLRNFKEDEVFVINTAGKPLPFKNHFETFTPSFNRLTQDVLKAMDSTKKKVIVVDDAQYIMSFQYMRRIKENGWDKWNDIQGDFFNIIEHAKEMPADTVVYFLSHLQRDDEGHEKIKTMGKMLDEKITIEGLFTIVLKTSVKDGTYCFLTQNSGLDTVKSPIGMFDSYAIDNDLKYVDTKIRNYYEIGDYVPDEAVKALDAEVAKPDVAKPDPDGKTRRRKDRTAEVAKVDTGTGTIVGATPAEMKALEAETPEDNAAAAKPLETAVSEPKTGRTRRKSAAVDESVKEDEKPAETGAESVTIDAAAVGAADAPAETKRTRRRKTAEERALEGFHAISDDDIPF